jgi:hypothetical protein
MVKEWAKGAKHTEKVAVNSNLKWFAIKAGKYNKLVFWHTYKILMYYYFTHCQKTSLSIYLRPMCNFLKTITGHQKLIRLWDKRRNVFLKHIL